MAPTAQEFLTPNPSFLFAGMVTSYCSLDAKCLRVELPVEEQRIRPIALEQSTKQLVFQLFVCEQSQQPAPLGPPSLGQVSEAERRGAIKAAISA